ncbi:hypothetical protein OXX69_008853, partial [Metschnikowia pulcherrima]
SPGEAGFRACAENAPFGPRLANGRHCRGHEPSDPDHRICKRITGMPGDVILVDPSASSSLTNSPAKCVQNDGYNKYVEVPAGHVWVTGDNLSHSLDSRSYSWLPMGLIKGKVIAANSMDKGLWDENGNFWFYNFRWLKNTFVDE